MIPLHALCIGRQGVFFKPKHELKIHLGPQGAKCIVTSGRKFAYEGSLVPSLTKMLKEHRERHSAAI